MTDCIVVGGGMIGLFVARELHDAGASVLLVERGEAARESSWAGGGILSPLYPWRYPGAASELVRWSQQRYPAIVDALEDASGYKLEWIQSGMLVLGPPDTAEAIAWASQYEVPLEVLGSDEIKAKDSGLYTGKAPAAWLPNIAHVRTPRLGKALRKSLQASGVAFRENCMVEQIRTVQGRVQGVETSQGYLSADNIVVAGGAWSNALLASLGVSIPVKPIRGQMICIQAPPGLLTRIVLDDGHYLIPRQDGRVLVGSTVEDVGFNKEVTGQARAELYEFALSLVPGLAAGNIEHHWAGLRPGSPSNLPIIGNSPQIKGLWINTGHFRNGLVMAPASARLLVDTMLKRPEFTGILPFLPG